RAGRRHSLLSRRRAGERVSRNGLRSPRPLVAAQQRAAHADPRLHRHARDRLFLDAPLKDFKRTLNETSEGHRMNKILVGLIAGTILGAIDGATAWFTPAVRDQMLGIIIGSTVKGIIAGIAAGWYARRVQSVPKGVVFGFVVGLVLAFAIAAIPQPD